ncbi:putative methyltransferase YcgJ [Novipirellula galeiformis]|uniref:Putative methyltransferase YcgJ n=1 Tax=Novipirellula galeiformis TaxID=2528004 RepID=A0A5C6CMP9_9BACT|nr:class I SAM-dependent methyltransferase [Novipirellula galeiformis]TWU26203.1 putative methyltransferase YcgJ [Novipirellula galeiformis]
MSTVSPTKDAKSAEPHRSRLYNNLVPVYQGLWPAVAKRNIRSAIAALNISSGTEVLEVGVGTGLSLDSYPHDIRLTGVDLSEAMLAEAEQLVAQKQWSHINVLPMNAERLTFEDNGYDVVTSFHTISVVSKPRSMMSEMVRVCRPGGKILMVNHFRSENPLIAKVVDSAGNITRRLGWRTDLNLQDVVAGLPLRFDRCYKPTPMSFFTIMEATVTKGDA